MAATDLDQHETRERELRSSEGICAKYFIFSNCARLPDDHHKILYGTVVAFIKVAREINSKRYDKVGHPKRRSNWVLSQVRPHLEHNGWAVEPVDGKRIVVKFCKTKINPDAQYKEETKLKAIVEVEGPRAWVASAWAKDLTKAMKTKQDYLILAVRNQYTTGRAKTMNNDFKRIGDELKYLNPYPLKAVLLIGY